MHVNKNFNYTIEKTKGDGSKYKGLREKEFRGSIHNFLVKAHTVNVGQDTTLRISCRYYISMWVCILDRKHSSTNFCPKVRI